MTIPLPDYSLHDEATLFLAHPKVELSGPDPFKQIFTNFTPRSHFALLTGPCKPLPGSEFTYSDSSNNSVQAVVVTSRVPQPIEGEVQYFTELMKLKGEIENVRIQLNFQILCFDQNLISIVMRIIWWSSKDYGSIRGLHCLLPNG